MQAGPWGAVPVYGLHPGTAQYVDSMLNAGWSVQQIFGHLQQTVPNMNAPSTQRSGIIQAANPPVAAAWQQTVPTTIAPLTQHTELQTTADTTRQIPSRRHIARSSDVAAMNLWHIEPTDLNPEPDTMFDLFTEALTVFGHPTVVHTQELHGAEDICEEIGWQCGHDSFITGPHQIAAQRKRGYWNFMSTHLTQHFKTVFHNMESDGILDRQRAADLYSLISRFQPLLDQRLQECCTDCSSPEYSGLRHVMVAQPFVCKLHDYRPVINLLQHPWQNNSGQQSAICRNNHTVRAQGVRSGGSPSYRPIHRFMTAVLGEDGWTSNGMREICVRTFEEPIDYTQSTPTKHKSKYNLLTQNAPLIASPLDLWEQEACSAMHRLLTRDLLQNQEGCISSYKLHKQQAVMLAEIVAGAQVMSELVTARPWYGSTDAEWAQWIAAAPAEIVPIRR